MGIVLLYFVGLPLATLWLVCLWRHPIVTIFTTLILIGLLK